MVGWELKIGEKEHEGNVELGENVGKGRGCE